MDPAQVVHMMLVTQYLDTLKQVLCMRVHGTCMCCVCACITMNVVLGALAVCASQAGMDLNTPTHPPMLVRSAAALATMRPVLLLTVLKKAARR